MVRGQRRAAYYTPKQECRDDDAASPLSPLSSSHFPPASPLRGLTPTACVEDDGELRVDPADGNAYTRSEFVDCYGGLEEWDQACNDYYEPVTPSMPVEDCLPEGSWIVMSGLKNNTELNGKKAEVVGYQYTFESTLVQVALPFPDGRRFALRAANLIPADSPSDFTSSTEVESSSAAPPADVADPLQTAAEGGAGRAFIDLFAMQTDEAEQRAAIVVEGLSGAGCIAVKCFATSTKASTASPQRQARGEVGRLKQVVDSLRSQLVAKDLQLTQLRRQFNIPQAPATLCPEDCDRISIQSSPSPQRKATRGCATYTVPVESFEPMDTDATPNAPQTLTGAGRPRWRSPALT